MLFWIHVTISHQHFKYLAVDTIFIYFEQGHNCSCSFVSIKNKAVQVFILIFFSTFFVPLKTVGPFI